MACERELIERAVAGDETAVITLYHQHKTAIYTYLHYRVGGDPALAEDITADVFERMVLHLPNFVVGERPLRAWLYTIARNRLLDHLRLHGKNGWSSLDEQLPSSASSLEEQSHHRLEQDRVAEALAHLTDEQREVVILRFLEEYNVAETAAVMGKKAGAVKTLTRRALAALRRLLEREIEHDSPTK
ncbi:MAG: sigma-70 family RNA polymerase sigma factor [Ardenticatenaceae bacterium]|nr:sigma-70 family RNA polymerase sigma factor [Ardenticatenaceae bacterium]